MWMPGFLPEGTSVLGTQLYLARCLVLENSDFEMGWDLRPFAAGLAPGHTSPQATKYKKR